MILVGCGCYTTITELMLGGSTLSVAAHCCLFCGQPLHLPQHRGPILFSNYPILRLATMGAYNTSSERGKLLLRCTSTFNCLLLASGEVFLGNSRTNGHITNHSSEKHQQLDRITTHKTPNSEVQAALPRAEPIASQTDSCPTTRWYFSHLSITLRANTREAR